MYLTFLVQNAFKHNISPHQFQTIKYIIEIKPKKYHNKEIQSCHNISRKINCLFMLKMCKRANSRKYETW